ncbi:MAG: histidinol-phosphatase HisJ family protein, partial [Ruminococcaceae bacterium]|nr:histidinol-phosphatase HisJ family protein [Oscillospiraceae bacterium]
MNKYPLLQAHRGVASEYPENTYKAFYAAIVQGYPYIELDPNYTLDRKIVVLHDSFINRTARKADGAKIEEKISICDISYEDASEYDYGIYRSHKFKGEKLPLFEEVLSMAKENGVKVKIDNKVERFPEDAREILWDILKRYETTVALTSAKEEMITRYAEAFPTAELHYDGAVDEAVLLRLSAYRDRLTVWMPYHSDLTSWAKVPYADEDICVKVNEVAKLGVWLINDYESFDEVCERFDPDIVETTGVIKPLLNEGCLCDMHTHSQNSHDSTCPVAEMAEAEIEKGIFAMAVSDHCDLQAFIERNIAENIKNSFYEAKREAENFKGRIKILKGIELGEIFWGRERAREILENYGFDFVIGSMHAARYKDEYSIPYDEIDFTHVSRDDVDGLLRAYFNDLCDMMEEVPCDVLAHISCPLRYINGLFGFGMDTRDYEEEICRVLKTAVKHSVALEVNTSGIAKKYGLIIPEKWILEKYRELGGYLVTLGSDAHVTRNAAIAFPEAISLLKECGFRNIF